MSPSINDETGPADLLEGEASSPPRGERPPILLVLCCGLAIAYCVAFIRNSLWLLPLLTTMFCTAIIAICALSLALIHRRYHRAFLHLAGLLTLIVALSSALNVQAAASLVAFYWHRSAYEAVVADRRNQIAPTPVRMILDVEDRSIFVTSNLFEYIVYDETDRLLQDPNAMSGWQSDSTSDTGNSQVFGSDSWSTTATRIEGHYYKLLVSS